MIQSTRLLTAALLATTVFSTAALAASDGQKSVDNEVIAAQRAALAKSTDGAGFGPQAPRDINSAAGSNNRQFAAAPAYQNMNLCNIHFHENAEHKGGEFTTYAGNGDGKGYHTGFKYDGTLSEAELAPIDTVIGASPHGDLTPGDTIEIHFVHSSADITPGPTLGACISDSIKNPQLRVETVVAVLVNDPEATDFRELAKVAKVDGRHQAVNLPDNLGNPVSYAGSTTGPGYNEKGSPFQVTWNVPPKVLKIDIRTVGFWLEGNIFEETHAHGVRNLVVNPDLLSPISN